MSEEGPRLRILFEKSEKCFGDASMFDRFRARFAA
jgi:hypothetical protein